MTPSTFSYWMKVIRELSCEFEWVPIFLYFRVVFIVNLYYSERLQVFAVSPSPSQARLVRPVVLVEVRFLEFLGVSHRPCVSCIIGQM